MHIKSIFSLLSFLFLQLLTNTLAAQNITGFSPTSVCAGSANAIEVNGSGFLNTVGVKIGVTPVSYNIVNDSLIQILNINGANTGRIVIETDNMNLTSPNDLIITVLNPNLTASSTGIVCESEEITYTSSGGSFYEFFVNGVSQGSISPNNSITFTPKTGDNIYAKVFDSSMNCASNTNVITAQLQPISKAQLISPSASLSVCNNDPMSSSIIFQLTSGANDAFITGLPTGVTAEISGNNVIINGIPNVTNAQDYNYVITPVGVPCAESVYGTISVTLDAQLSLSISSGDTTQVICEESPLEPITFEVSGGATSASVTGLPTGVTANYDSTAKVLSIEGTPSDNISQEKKYNYTVTTNGSNCTEQVMKGTITVKPLAQLTLLPTSGSLNQVLCEGEAIEPILIALEGGADLVNVSGLPNGIVYSLDTTTQVASIYGTPASPVNVFSEFSYVISSISDYCTETTLQGNFRIDGDSTLTHDTTSGDTTQVICEESPLEPITFEVGGGATSASVIGLPTGVTAIYDSTAKLLSIEGTPSDNISQEKKYNYSVTTSGSSCTEQVMKGTITVKPLAQLTLLPTSGSLDQVLCEGEAIEPILIALEGGDNITNVSGLPDGLQYTFNNVTKILNVSGTPKTNITANENSLISFAVATSCNTAYLTGNILRIPEPTVKLISHLKTQNQLVCGTTPLEKIQYQLNDGATSVDVTGLPPGVDWTKNGNYVEISGIPDDVVYETNFEYSIYTEGNGCSSTLNFSIIVTPNTLEKPTADSTQFFCIYDAPKIKDIVVFANKLIWYSADGLSVLDPETPLVDGETYYAHNEIIVSEASSIDRYACRSYPTSIQVFVQDTPPPQVLEPSNRFCLDGQYTLADIKVNAEEVVWYSTYTSILPLSMETPLESMTYYAASIDPKTGCESLLRTEFEVYVEPCTVKVYNALSVNGDGMNEKLMIDNISYFPDNEIVIYNRNGRVVYKTSNYGVSNNFFRGYSNISGTNNSKILPMGTYFYTISYTRPRDGQTITTNGFINLVTN